MNEPNGKDSYYRRRRTVAQLLARIIALEGYEVAEADPYPFGRNDDKSSLDKAGNPIGPYYYATSELYPFAIDLPVTDYRIPDEMVKIDVFYPYFADWVKSRGEKHKEWYKNSVK